MLIYYIIVGIGVIIVTITHFLAWGFGHRSGYDKATQKYLEMEQFILQSQQLQETKLKSNVTEVAKDKPKPPSATLKSI